MLTLQAVSTQRPVPDILAFNHEMLLERFVRDHGGTLDDARRKFIGLKQFLIICALGNCPKVPSPQVDDMWHTFLLFTRDYQSFCNDYLGRFVHHQPFGAFPPGTYRDTRESALALFGELDDELWPLKESNCGSGSSGCLQ